MRTAVPFFILLSSACTYNYTPVQFVNREAQAPDQFDSESAASLLKRIQECENGKWMLDLQKIRNSYAAVLPVMDDEQAVLFSVAMFKALARNDELDLGAIWLPCPKEALPNTIALKFFFEAEKELERMAASMREFVDCPQADVKRCATEAMKYFQFRKDCFAAIRDVDYRRLKKKDVPMEIPPEVLRENARMLEQRDQMAQSLVEFYNSFPKNIEPADLPKPVQ